MATTGDSTSKLSLPSSSTFSFTAPFPTPADGQLHPKQRRVSLALPSSPRLVPAWSFRDDTRLDSHAASVSNLAPEKKGKMRRIATEDQSPDRVVYTEKRQRKKWTEEETQMLVNGCNIWGVGNWKAILNDPNLVFANRSPVDLKDRFRTFFPDAYKLHYPNAKTHLSSKVRSTLPDGTSLFEKTRSKKRRPFTPEEDQALKAGYEKHGTVWSTIVKDPIFQEQKRRSTDLRDRFRNAFPHLYTAAGYKPRIMQKKKMREDTPIGPIRAATDDQIPSTRVRRSTRPRRATNPGQSQSLPQSVACSEDEDTSGDEDDSAEVPKPASFIDEATPQPEEMAYPPDSSFTEVDMHTIDPLSDLCDPLAIPEFMHSSQSMSEMNDSQTWSDQQSPRYMEGWPSVTTTASPTSSQISTADYFAKDSPFERRNDGFGMIGRSAWGPSDWLSANPRLDPSATSSSSSSFIGGQSPTPSSPFSFSNVSHGIMDRYDLSRTSFAHDFASEVGPGDSHSTFSDPDMFSPQSFRGFTHHSDYAGDLIFGARSHQPQGQMNLSSSLGFGYSGLGLSGVSQAAASINPMQLHTPGLPGIDELELTSIRLDDHVEEDEVMASTAEVGVQKDDSEASLSFPADLSSLINLPPQTLEEIVGLTSTASPQIEQDMATTPPATPVTRSRSPRELSGVHHYPSIHSRSMSVPPFEHRSPPPPARAQPSHSEPMIQPMSRTASQYEHPPSHDPESTPLHAASFASMDAFRSSGDLYDLPFLDLHYYSGSVISPHDVPDSTVGGSRHGQALDLAQTQSLPYSNSLIGSSHAPPINCNAHPAVPTARQHPSHHRGQSAVSPKDLLLRTGKDNKRKRASWDGGGT